MSGSHKVPKIKVRVIGEFIPEYKSEHAAGCDLCASVEQSVVLQPGAYSVIPTGIRIEIPPGYEAQVRPRSGLAAQHGIGVLNGPGTIDADYRGEIKVIIFNFGRESFTIKRGDRIAQLVFSAVVQVDFAPVQSLSPTGRGKGGFGHTGT
ncbi:dUTP diphosphatase [candidate division WOR-3 bacterium]|nr:dUTP diphosphatase [candidate division WOR-3 bacterium]